jgi:hypothetical protein
MSKVKQRSFSISFSELADYLKNEHGFPDDIEICVVEHVPNSTLISVTVHSDSFTPVPTRYHQHSLYPLEGIVKRWRQQDKESRYDSI